MASEIKSVNIEDEMRQSYLDYAMSVIIGRALPDVRDGLKPVHRRVLYAMHEQGYTHDKPYKKSARIVGDVIGKYHPHGDAAVYDTMVRMVQEFSMRVPPLDGQGNFGSVDGDNAAAMRYTEVRMAKVAREMLADIEKETVDWATNYDDSLQEPTVLPSRIPNLLLNGSGGIAVGMATNIAPHNLEELCDGLLAVLERPDISVDELMEHIPGPDFPTGGFIHGVSSIREAYATGRGVIQLRARTHFEEIRENRTAIVVTELPYQVNKARLIEKIAELVKDKKLDGISDLRDESDRDGMRMVVELKRGEQPEIVLNRLFKTTALQTSFGINAVALRDNQPQLLPLRAMLQAFLEHREEIVVRRTRYELRKARERAHILEGLVKALDNLDAVIRLIRESADPATAKAGLMEDFDFTEAQASAILDMRLQRLTGLERDKIQTEYEEIMARIRELEAILASRERVLEVVADEIREIRASYGDERRTEIVEKQAELSLEDLIPDEEMVVMLTHRGYIKRISLDEFRQQRRGGKGKTGIGTREEDWVEDLFVARAHSYLLFFTDQGRVHWLKVYQLPEVGRTAKGIPVVNLLELGADERVSTLLPVRDFDVPEDLFFVTQHGVVKRSALEDYSRPRTGGINAINLDEGDAVMAVFPVIEADEVILVTRRGQGIRFQVEDARQMGRVTRGVRGLSLADGDEVVSGIRVRPGVEVLTVTDLGYGKRTELDGYRTQGRGGKGVRAMRLTDKTGEIVGVLSVHEDDQLMLVTDTGRIVRTDIESISQLQRDTQGVRLMRLDKGERIVGVARVITEEDEVDAAVGDETDGGAEPGPGEDDEQ